MPKSSKKAKYLAKLVVKIQNFFYYIGQILILIFKLYIQTEKSYLEAFPHQFNIKQNALSTHLTVKTINYLI